MPRPRTILLALAALVLGGAFLAWLLGGGPDDPVGAARSGGAASSSDSRSSESASDRLPDAITFVEAPGRSRSGNSPAGTSPRRPSGAAPPAPIRPGELSGFETVPYPLGTPAYGGEPVTAYLRVASLERDLACETGS